MHAPFVGCTLRENLVDFFLRAVHLSSAKQEVKIIADDHFLALVLVGSKIENVVPNLDC